MFSAKYGGKRTIVQIFSRIFESFDVSNSVMNFIKTIKIVSNKKNFKYILDAGCGDGRFAFWLAQNYSDIKIDACDISEEKIKFCKEIQIQLSIDNINFFVQDLRTFQTKGFYDFVFSNHVLEHIYENKLVVSNLVYSLKKEGYLYIQMPNMVQKRIFPKKLLISLEEWEKREHVGQTLTLTSLSSELKHLGCKILTAEYKQGFWGELGYEIRCIALGLFNRYSLYILLLPIQKLFEVIDHLTNYSDGNNMLVLAKRS